MNNQKGIASTLAIIIVIAIGVIAIGGVLAYQYLWAPEEEVEKEEIPKEKSITVISPNGGEEWEIEKTYKIEWDYAGDDNNLVNIELWDGESGRSIIVSKILASQRYYNWKIPATIGSSSYLANWETPYIYVGLADTIPYVGDSSDNYFDIIEKGEIINWDDRAKSFCENKGNVVKYSSLINFDQDEDKEIILMCSSVDFDWGTESQAILDLYVLNKENGSYQIAWEKNTEEDFYLRAVSKPKIIDLDEDGVDEIFISGSNWGGTCTGSFSYYLLYSPKHNELFSGIFGSGGKGYVGGRSGSFVIFEETDDYWPCPEYEEGVKIAYLSNNLKKIEYQIFRTYLEELLWERINEVPVE